MTPFLGLSIHASRPKPLFVGVERGSLFLQGISLFLVGLFQLRVFVRVFRRQDRFLTGDLETVEPLDFERFNKGFSLVAVPVLRCPLLLPL
jgi:hypothetical protein